MGCYDRKIQKGVPVIVNSHGRVWVRHDEELPEYLGATGIHYIRWEGPHVAEVQLYTRMGLDSNALQQIESGDRIEVLYSECGKPNIYDKHNVWYVMEDLWGLSWTVVEPVILSPDMAGTIEMTLTFKCKLTERPIK